MIGLCEQGSASRCYAKGVVTGNRWVGGFSGESYGGYFEKCYASGQVSGSLRVGGLVGYNTGLGSSTGIFRCYSQSEVVGGTIVGGLVGFNNGIVENSWSGGAVGGQDFVGGLIGTNEDVVTDSYSFGPVISDSNAGGLVGYNNAWNTPLVVNSFWDVQTSGKTNMCGSEHCYSYCCDSSYGRTTAQMTQQSNFAGWDFSTIWLMRCEGMNYPKLNWQAIPAADFVCPYGVDFIDYAFFAERWMDTNCAANGNCNGTDFDSSGTVDIADLKVFCGYWLQGQ